MNILKSVIHDTKTNSVEATWVDADGAQVRCHSYADVQMQMFRNDVAQLGGDIAEHEAMIAAVEAAIVPYVPPVPTTEQIITTLTIAVQAHLDATAKLHGYDGILSACTYATDTHLPFQAEGQACVNWRGSVWGTCYTIMAEVQAGTHAMPTDESLIAELPTIAWPT